jgi:hypothetical protein
MASMKRNLDKKDWLLLVIAAAKGESVSLVQLQKALFLIGQNVDRQQLRCKSFYDFRPYDYGPFDSGVYRDAERLQEEGGIVITEASPRTYREYLATAAGMEKAGSLKDQLDASTQDFLERVVKWVRSLPFSALLRAIYTAYPEMKVNSVFQG